ncbi:MAG: hypothetical protein KAT54_09070 [Candidatus Marinimicrobia bacterium]|nr:hypothetical protein [Candidatus Neomarinimicrobiota bacterium]
METVKENVKKIVTKVAEDCGAYLVGFSINLQGSRTFVKVVVESIDGITMEEITSVTKELNANEALDKLLTDGYRLEVTSPGSDYKLKEYRDFPRNVGRLLKVFHTNSIVKSPFKSELKEVNKDRLVFEIKGDLKEITFNELDYAKIVLKW